MCRNFSICFLPTLLNTADTHVHSVHFGKMMNQRGKDERCKDRGMEGDQIEITEFGS